MKKALYLQFPKQIKYLLILLIVNVSVAQISSKPYGFQSKFWNHVQFGGGIGLSIGSGYSDVMLAPVAIYKFNNYIGTGVGFLGSYASSKDRYTSLIYGPSALIVVNPVEMVQLSVEVEELKINTTYETTLNSYSTSFWNTGLYVGAGYRTENVVLGARYNLLFDKSKNIYNDALTPFIRIYF